MAGRRFQLWVTVTDWHDGDTCHGVLDQGFWTYRGRDTDPIRCRAALIQAPELTAAGKPDPAGVAALEFALLTAPPGEYPCWSYKPAPDTYGRPLLDLILPDGRLFSAVMLQAGHAVPYRA